jgi:hypothetical protein
MDIATNIYTVILYRRVIDTKRESPSHTPSGKSTNEKASISQNYLSSLLQKLILA